MLGRERYYVDKDRGHDFIIRCKDCVKLVVWSKFQEFKGCCPNCGNKRFTEVTLLKQEEMDAILSGELDFEDKEEFLAEFQPVGEAAAS